jgi:hypothetical protein
MKSGMKFLIESFYRSITDDAPLPLSYREILLTAVIMDSIFEQLTGRRAIDGAARREDRRAGVRLSIVEGAAR